MVEKDNRLWFLEKLGLVITSKSGGELVGTCPFCDKQKHFYLSSEKVVYDCKVCGERGNYFSLLKHFSTTLREGFTEEEKNRLAKSRNLPPEAFEGFGFGWSGSLFTLPLFDFNGQFINLLWYHPKEKIKSAPRCQSGLFRADVLADTERENEPVFLCEGPWDAIALEWLRTKSHAKGIVVAAPGVNVFKNEWCNSFRGREVFIGFDNDQPGALGEQLAATMLSGVAGSLRFFRWTDEDKNGCDFNDLIGGFFNGNNY
ncbi:MAG: CHC2 zinc finger domain-containing protein [Phycisphaerae bacterium]